MFHVCIFVSSWELVRYLSSRKSLLLSAKWASRVPLTSVPWINAFLATDEAWKVLFEKKFQSSESFGSRFRRGAQVVWGILQCPGTLSRKKCNFDTDWFLQLHQKKAYGISQDKIALLVKFSELKIKILIQKLPKAQRTRGLNSGYQSNFFRSYHKLLAPSGALIAILTY